MKMCDASGSVVDRETASSRRVLTEEKLKIVDSAFTANGRVCTVSTNCNKTGAFTYKKSLCWFLQFTTQFEANLNFVNWKLPLEFDEGTDTTFFLCS